MLLEFSVTNFRSIGDRQSLSLVPGSSREVRQRFSHVTGVKGAPYALRVAGIFGPNGSGKSALIQAMSFMRRFVVDSAREGQEGDKIDVKHFLFGAEDTSDLSEFEIVILLDGMKYQYGFMVNSEKVHAEWLYVVPPTGRMQRWFERSVDSETGIDSWYINPSIKGEKETWRKSTRDNALFLSQAVQLRAESFQPIFHWFQKKLKVIPSSQRLSDNYTAKNCGDADQKAKILELMSSVDTGIADFETAENEITEDIISSVFTGEMKEHARAQLKDKKFFEVRAGRRNISGDLVYLDMADESDGTRVLFALAGPWIDVLENGHCLIIDELSNSLHPLAYHYLVDLINSSNNKNGAQLIFTSHDTSILTGKKMHPDEINFVEKSSALKTVIKPLSDFEVRSDEAIQRGYLGGRYGALPVIG